jgi:redox-sensing transcriptional repressor
MTPKLPDPTIIRLSSIYQLLCNLEKIGVKKVSSTELGKQAGVPSHTIRKDINFFGEIGNTGSGYEVTRLKDHIAQNLGFGPAKKACVVGLGRLGFAIIQTPVLAHGEFAIVAGFDSNINKLETIKTSIGLFPSYDIPEMVGKMGIELGIIAVSPEGAQEAADRLVDGGVRGIVNFTSAVITPKTNGVRIRQVDLANELRILSAMITMDSTGLHDITKNNGQ